MDTEADTAVIHTAAWVDILTEVWEVIRMAVVWDMVDTRTEVVMAMVVMA